MLHYSSLNMHIRSAGVPSTRQPQCQFLQRPDAKLPGRRGVAVGVGWDPENILANPQAGHIARRQMQKQMGSDKVYSQEVAAAREKAQKQTAERRASRVPPQVVRRRELGPALHG